MYFLLFGPVTEILLSTENQFFSFKNICFAALWMLLPREATTFPPNPQLFPGFFAQYHKILIGLCNVN